MRPGGGSAAFSAGMNIETFAGLDPAGAKAFIGQLAGIMRAIRRLMQHREESSPAGTGGTRRSGQA